MLHLSFNRAGLYSLYDDPEWFKWTVVRCVVIEVVIKVWRGDDNCGVMVGVYSVERCGTVWECWAYLSHVTAHADLLHHWSRSPNLTARPASKHNPTEHTVYHHSRTTKQTSWDAPNFKQGFTESSRHTPEWDRTYWLMRGLPRSDWVVKHHFYCYCGHWMGYPKTWHQFDSALLCIHRLVCVCSIITQIRDRHVGCYLI